MNLTLLLVLLAGAFFAAQAGLMFVALLLLAIAVLVALTGSGSGGSSSHGQGGANVNITEPYGPEGPIVVENKMPDMPYQVFLKLKHDWHDYRQFEYSMFNWGSAWNNMGNFLWKLISGQRPKPKDH